MVGHGPLPMLMHVPRHIRKGPAFESAKTLTGSKEESCTVKMAMHRVLIMKTFEDLYWSNGGGLEASLFPHARISRLVVMMQDRTRTLCHRKQVMTEALGRYKTLDINRRRHMIISDDQFGAVVTCEPH